MTDKVEDFLAHHGVLGMHWGVIREKAAAGNRGAQKKLAKADTKWEKEINTTAGFIKVNNRMADYLNGPNGGYAKLNSHYSDDADFTVDSPLSRKYYKEAEKVQNDAFSKAVKDIYGESPSGKKSAVVKFDKANNPYLEIVNSELSQDTALDRVHNNSLVKVPSISHADSGALIIPLITDSKGRITGLGTAPKVDALAHSGEDFLSHHGVLGMHWGKHLAGRTEESHNPKPKKRVDAHPEHAEAHTLAKQPISTLSTSELQKVNNRLQAEKKYKELNPSTVKKGHNAVKTVIAVGGTVTALVALANTPAGKALISSGKKALDSVINDGAGRHILIEGAKHL